MQKLLRNLIGMLIALTVLWVVSWFAAAHVSENALADLATAEAQRGHAVRYELDEKSGFPWRVTLRLKNLAWQSADGIDLQAASLDVSTSPLNWWRFEITSTLPLALELPLFANAVVLKTQMDTLQATVDLSGPGDGEIAFAHGDGLGLAIKAGNLSFPGQNLPLAGKIQNLELGLRISDKLPLPTAPALRQWRDAGGTLEVDYLQLDWGALQLIANGTIALDKNLQPEGALTSQITGFQEAIDAMLAAQTIQPTIGSIMKGALLLFSKPNEKTGRQEVKAPITLQNGQLFVGPAAVMALPHYQWPETMPEQVH
jgi:hypothetical protein